MNWLHDFHFLRPLWFIGLLPLLFLVWQLWHRQLTGRRWRDLVDPALLPHLLIGEERTQHRVWPLGLALLGGILTITALAGPVWQKLEQPLFRQQSALVLLLDLSRSMDATDVKPSRLQRVKLKVQDILRKRHEGQTALVVFAAQPYVVTPLTDDTRTIASQLPSLDTSLMPAQGSRPDLAFDKAIELLHQAGMTDAQVLLITDGVSSGGQLDAAVARLRDAGHRLSILAVGTPQGAPIPLTEGGFLKGSDGAIVVPRLDPAPLKALADQGGGVWRQLSADDSDINALLGAEKPFDGKESEVKGMKSDQWREEGPWLLLPLLALAGFAFRRGYLAVILLALLPLPEPAQALEQGMWKELWQRPDQRGAAELQAGKPQDAAKLFEDPAWRATAHYRAGDYEAALKELEGLDTPDAHYNRGNALAKLGKLPEALKAYETALKQAPDNRDAQANHDLIEQLLKEQQQSQQGNDGQQQENKDPSSQQQKQDGEQGEQQQEKADQGRDTQQQANGEPQQNNPQEQNAAAPKEGDKNQTPQPDPQQTTDRNPSEDPRASQDNADAAEERNKDKDTSTATATDDNGRQKPDDEPQPPVSAAQADDSKPMDEEQRATAQWLQRIPDDPGGLWRRKFLYQYQNQKNRPTKSAQPW